MAALVPLVTTFTNRKPLAPAATKAATELPAAAVRRTSYWLPVLRARLPTVTGAAGFAKLTTLSVPPLQAT